MTELPLSPYLKTVIIGIYCVLGIWFYRFKYTWPLALTETGLDFAYYENILGFQWLRVSGRDKQTAKFRTWKKNPLIYEGSFSVPEGEPDRFKITVERNTERNDFFGTVKTSMS